MGAWDGEITCVLLCAGCCVYGGVKVHVASLHGHTHVQYMYNKYTYIVDVEKRYYMYMHVYMYKC